MKIIWPRKGNNAPGKSDNHSMSTHWNINAYGIIRFLYKHSNYKHKPRQTMCFWTCSLTLSIIIIQIIGFIWFTAVFLRVISLKKGFSVYIFAKFHSKSISKHCDLNILMLFFLQDKSCCRCLYRISSMRSISFFDGCLARFPFTFVSTGFGCIFGRSYNVLVFKSRKYRNADIVGNG